MSNDLCEVGERIAPALSTTATDSSRSQLLQCYEAIAEASCGMLAAAHAGDWHEVACEEARCCGLIATLKASAGAALSAADGARRMQLLLRILADDAQIRGHAEPWLESFTPYISTPRVGVTVEITSKNR